MNGDIVHRDEAKISVYYSGFMLGDGIWEGLRLYDGHIPFLNEHLDRLFEAALFIDLYIGKSHTELTQAIHDTLAANEMTTDVHIRLMVTRGKKRKPFQHPHLSIYGPTIVIIAEHSKPDEAFLIGTFGAQTPVFEIDGRVIGGGVAGPIFHRIRSLYKAEIMGAEE